MPVKIPLAKLKRIYNPLTSPPWECGKRISKKSIVQATLKGPKAAIAYSDCEVNWTRQAHIDRIAYLVAHGWQDPIEIDTWGCLLGEAVPDGNHRLAAAIYRKDQYILAKVSGDLEHAFEMFGVNCEEK